MVNRQKVLKAIHPCIKQGGYLVWLDQVFPMFSRADYELIGTIGLIRSTNHRVRAIFVFQKKGEVDMSTLEQLIGRPLHEISDDELEEIVLKGRLAREGEATAGRARRAGGGAKKKEVEIPDFDLNDFE
jgi:hypothetical protein